MKRRQAKSQCRPSSLLISSLENVRPGIRPLWCVCVCVFNTVEYTITNSHLFFNQKMAANEPEKKMPSTAANAIIRSPKVAVLEFIHFRAQSAFLFTQGTAQ